MNELGMATKDLEGWNRIVGFLHHVVKLGVAVFETGWWMLVDDDPKPSIEIGGRNALASAGIYVRG